MNVIVVSVVANLVTARAAGDAIDGVVKIMPALIVFSPAGAKELALLVRLGIDAEIKATSSAANGFSGSVLGVRRNLKSCGLVLFLTAAPF